MNVSRRAFLWTGALAVNVLLRTPGVVGASAPANVREYGARGDRRTKDTRAIQAAIDAAAAAGQAVHFPRGRYLSGTLRLRDRTTLHLEAGATLVASPGDGDFDRPEALGYNTFADDETSDQSFALLQGRKRYGSFASSALAPSTATAGTGRGRSRSRSGPATGSRSAI